MSSKPQRKKPTNAFHAIRKREFHREGLFLKGAEPSAVPAAYFTPSLKEICAQVIANTFEQQPNIDSLREVDEQLYRLITDQLRTDLRLEVSVPRVKVPEYWKACCEARWSVGQLAEYTGSMALEPPAKGGWKRVFLERNLEEHLMSLESAATTEKEEEGVVALCTLCGSEIYALRLSRQRSHFDIYELFSRLPHLEEFAVSFGVLNANVAVTPDMIGMKQQDALHIQKVLRTSKYLTKLALSENEIDDDLCRAIVGGLVKNATLLHLDLSHNRIGDSGAAAIGLVLLQPELELRTLDLSDNEIRETGAASLGDGVAVTRTLQSLSLRLNRLCDPGGETLLGGVRENGTLTELDLSNNELGRESANAISGIARENTTLLSLNVSCNSFGADCGEVLRLAAQSSKSLRQLDVRESGISGEDEQAITEEMRARVSRKHLDGVREAQARMGAEVDRLVTERIRKTHGV
uniref:Uncharacterized protein n=1 Tax=Neobodo designis TaxID=312471 RepID=A0A7S1WBE6_NEODS|eukprot:CAMPEP_0174831202 /NCGR_PEP_ID=MMETSP1114-20130205/2965_1 /TAXON_ID=312471 /ORGANISM="Neobodo designis, Strain CCAP 1951/1" /LENGTH=464 /DNA_ID=CAMNT_0016065023 /DNA_START=29 /DNA_END=1423 /DNA_ORIENTATION=+